MNEVTRKVDTKLFAERAEKMEGRVDRYFVDNSGKLRSAVYRETMKPFERGYFDNANHMIVPGYEDMDYADFVTYENVGMVTGAYLAAMCWKYKATGSENALLKARRTYQGIKTLYERSQAIAPGFYCKCWGDNVTKELSSDQTIYSMTGLDLYSEIANDSEKADIADIIGGMARFWKDCDYKYIYYGKLFQYERVRFPGFMALAYKHTGSQEFLDEFNRLIALDEVKKGVASKADFQIDLDRLRVSSPDEFEKNLQPGTRMTIVNSEKSQTGFLSIEPILELKLGDTEHYLDTAAKMFDYGKHAVAPDCSGLRCVLVNLQTERFQELDFVLQEGYISEECRGWKLSKHFAPLRYGTMATCTFARAAVGIHEYLPELGGLEIAMEILMNVPEDRMTWYEDPNASLPDDLKWMTQIYNGDAITHWLWTYWEAMAKYTSS